MKSHIQMLKRRAVAATAWRKENPELAPLGWVLFYRSQIVGWTRELDEPHRYVAGVMAIGVDGVLGKVFQASGGNEANGATEWSVIHDPAEAPKPDYQAIQARRDDRHIKAVIARSNAA